MNYIQVKPKSQFIVDKPNDKHFEQNSLEIGQALDPYGSSNSGAENFQTGEESPSHEEDTKRREARTDINSEDIDQDSFSRVSIISWKDFVGLKFEEPKWIVENMIPEKGLVAIAGAPESYKSFFSEYIAIKVAKGERLLDEFETIKTSVLIIDQENITSWQHKRFTQLSQDEDLPIYIFDKDTASFDLFDDSIIEEILNFIEEYGIGLVIIDTLRLAHNREENSSTDMKPVIDRLKELSKKAAILFIHHNRKSTSWNRTPTARGEDMMGSQTIRGNVDSQLTFTNLGEQPDSTFRIKITHTKSRFCKPFKTFEVSVEEVDGRLDFIYGGEFQEEKLKKEEAKGAILEFLEEQGLKRQEIIDRLASNNICGSRTAEGALKELKNEGNIKHTSKKPHIYSLVEGERSNFPQTAIPI